MAFCWTAGPRARMKTLIPVDAWPAAIAARLPAGERRVELDGRERVQRHGDDRGAGGDRVAAAQVHLDAGLRLRDRRDRRFEPHIELGAAGDRAKKGPRPASERHAPARVLRQRQAVAGKGVPAKHAHGARLLERPARERLELGDQDVPLLVGQLELVHPLDDRHPVEPRQAVDVGERVVRERKQLLGARDERVPPTLGDRVALGDRAGAALLTDVPRGELRLLADLDLEPGPHDLGPRVRLVPVHPPSAELDVEPLPGRGPGAAAEAVAGLDDERAGAAQRGLPRRGDPGEPPSHDDHVEHEPRDLQMD